MAEVNDITQYLIAWRNGDEEALNRLMPIVNDELQRLARRYLRSERPNHTLQTAALVNEAYLLLINQQQTDWQSRIHFFSIAARIMRNILVNHAVARNRNKRGGAVIRLPLEAAENFAPQHDLDILSLNDALEQLTAFDERKSKIIELHFFAGLKNEEIAEALGISLATINREWRFAKAWLYNYLKPNEESGEQGEESSQ